MCVDAIVPRARPIREPGVVAREQYGLTGAPKRETPAPASEHTRSHSRLAHCAMPGGVDQGSDRDLDPWRA